jgi:hypothetical protein
MNQGQPAYESRWSWLDNAGKFGYVEAGHLQRLLTQYVDISSRRYEQNAEASGSGVEGYEIKHKICLLFHILRI